MTARYEPLRSHFLVGTIRHRRARVTTYDFTHRVWYLALDLDEQDAVQRALRLLSFDRRNLLEVRTTDYLDGDGRGFRFAINSRLQALGFDPVALHVTLITYPRILGYVFNPVSFYFCLDRDGRPAAAIAEVTNTFREMKPFFLGPKVRRNGGFQLRIPKHFYVSPFSDVDVAFDFRLQPPDDGLAIQIDDYVGDGTFGPTVETRLYDLGSGDGRLVTTAAKRLGARKVMTLINNPAYVDLTGLYPPDLAKARKVTVLTGHATFTGPKSLQVTPPAGAANGAPVNCTAKNFVIATGSAPVELPFMKFDGQTVVSSDHAIAFDRVPAQLVVVGGGAIGLELGSVWARLGSKVTVVEFLPKIIASYDDDIARNFTRILQKQGLTIETGTKVTGLKTKAQDAKLATAAVLLAEKDGKAVEFPEIGRAHV